MKANPADQQAARAAAKRLFQKASFSGGALQSYEISSLLADTYQSLNIPFKPNSKDIKAYGEVLDANQDGQVTLNDLETLALHYLCGPGVLNGQSYSPASQQRASAALQYPTTTTAQYEGLSNQPYPAKINQYSNQKHNSTYTSQAKQFNTSSSQYTTTVNPKTESIQTGSPNLYGAPANQYGPYSTVTNPDRLNSQPAVREQQAQGAPQVHSVKQQTLSTNQQSANSQYNEQTLNFLESTKQIFLRHADEHNTITAERVGGVLAETYAAMGREGYWPSEEDVGVWMKLCDGNGDGHVQYEEYCYFVVHSLEREGYEVYK